MADNRTFWTGALCGAAVAYMTDRLLTWRRQAKQRLGVVGGAKILQIPLKRDAGAGDPSGLTPDRSRSRSGLMGPGFERRGGAPGSVAAAEVHEAPGHPGQRLDYTNPAQPFRSASRTQVQPPARDSQV